MINLSKYNVVVGQGMPKVGIQLGERGFLFSMSPVSLWTFQSDNGDVHENVAEKQTLHQFKLFRVYPNSPCYKKRILACAGERGTRSSSYRVSLMVEFIALPFPSPSKLKIWSFYVVVVQ